MLCSNCKINIPPEWKACYLENKCPACSGEIMNGAMKTLLEEVENALKEMPNDPQGLAGWLLSNYQMTKIGEAKPVIEFYGAKQKDASKTNPNVVQKKSEGSVLDRFQEKLGMNKSKYQDMVSEIMEDRPISSNGSDVDIQEYSSDQEDDSLNDALENQEFTKRVLASAVSMTAPTQYITPDPEISEFLQGKSDIEIANEKMREYMERGKMIRGEAGSSKGMVSRLR